MTTDYVYDASPALLRVATPKSVRVYGDDGQVVYEGSYAGAVQAGYLSSVPVVPIAPTWCVYCLAMHDGGHMATLGTPGPFCTSESMRECCCTFLKEHKESVVVVATCECGHKWQRVNGEWIPMGRVMPHCCRVGVPGEHTSWVNWTCACGRTWQRRPGRGGVLLVLTSGPTVSTERPPWCSWCKDFHMGGSSSTAVPTPQCKP